MTSNHKCLIVYDKCINRKSKFPLTTKFVTKPVWIVGCLSVESMFCYAFAKLCENISSNNLIIFFTKFHAHHLNICEHQLWLFNSRLSRIEKIDVVCNNKIQLKSFHLVLEVCHKLLVVGFFSIRLKSQTGHYLSVANFDKFIRITLLWRKKYKS